MFETQFTDHEKIMAHARQLRAEAMRDLLASMLAVFSRKPKAAAVHA
ncbi:RSP_7527 family protein [Pseudotabrizicola sp. L79]